MSEILVVNEIFFSLQGESTYAGRPCAFVRLSRCDLRCTWCDTTYAFHEGQKMTVDQVLAKVSTFPTQLVEVTGGEPLLQEHVFTLIHRLQESGKQVLVETGGHRSISKVDPETTLIYDLKCPDSGMSHRNRWENLPLLRPHDQIKFVIASRRDYEWAKEKIAQYQLTQKQTVLFSPVWETVSFEDLAEWILRDGLDVRFQLQLHKLIWGAETRGV